MKSELWQIISAIEGGGLASVISVVLFLVGQNQVTQSFNSSTCSDRKVYVGEKLESFNLSRIFPGLQGALDVTVFSKTRCKAFVTGNRWDGNVPYDCDQT
jgi:hypothetical protein